jgi:hypothetical protein
MENENLTDEVLTGFRFVNTGEGMYGPTYKRSVADCNYVLTRDWRSGTSFHVGLEYTDAPDPNDDYIVHNFAHEIDTVSKLRNLWFASQHIQIDDETAN